MVGSVQMLSSSCAEMFTKAASGVNTKNICAIKDDQNYFNNVISVLREPLQTFSRDLMKEDSSPAVDKVDNFEVSTRSKLLSFVQTLLEANKLNDLAQIQESIEDILQYTREVIDFCNCLAKKPSLGINTAQLRKLPFLLLEDAVETLPTSLVQIIWRYGASTWLETLLCKNGSTLFHQGSRYCLIRMCNKLLKNLSVSAQDGAAQFAGEISMILASVFPLSERSAVNVLGAFHVDAKYQVEYETLEEWMEGGSGHAGAHETSNINSGGYGKGKKVALNYGFYSKFWAIQNVLTDPRSLLPKNTNPQWNQNIDNFVMDVQDVLGTFEGYEFAEDLVKHLKARWNTIKLSKVNKISQMKAIAEVVVESGVIDDDVEMEDAESKNTRDGVASTKRQYKYLTNSQLLHLQLQDPEIRVHFLSQLFILSSFLSKALSDFALTTTGATTANKMSNEKLQGSVEQLEKRAGNLMKQVPPNGELHFSTLQWILKERESSWRHWKSKKCTPAIEKFASSAAIKDDDIASKRRKLMGNSTTEIKSVKANAATYLYKIDLVQDLPKISQGMSQYGSGLDDYFEEYVDALDPEAGIEEEYHPKNNKLSSWRALRMLSRKHIGHLGEKNGFSMIQKKSGDFEGIVRKIWKEEKGQNIRGDMPKEEQIFDDEADMDDTSDMSVKGESKDSHSLPENNREADDITELGEDKEEGGKTVDGDVLESTTSVKDDDEDDGEIDESDDIPPTNRESKEAEEKEITAENEIDVAVDVEEHIKEEPYNRKRKREDTKGENKNSNGKSQKNSGTETASKESESAKESNRSKSEQKQESDVAAVPVLRDSKANKPNKDEKHEENKTDGKNGQSLRSNGKGGTISADTEKKALDGSHGRRDGSRKEHHKSSAVPTQHDAKARTSDNEGKRSGATRKQDGDSAPTSTSAQGTNSATTNVVEKEMRSTSRVRGSDSSHRNKAAPGRGRQPEPRSQNNQPPQRRMDNRRKEDSQSPQPPSRREQVQDNRGGHGTHTRFISPPPTGRPTRDDRGAPRQQGRHGGPGGGGQRQFHDSARPRGNPEPRDGRGNGGSTDRRSGNDAGRGGGRNRRQGGRR